MYQKQQAYTWTPFMCYSYEEEKKIIYQTRHEKDIWSKMNVEEKKTEKLNMWNN